MQHYVVGFIVDQTEENVLLIRKTKPDWQCGLLNAVGGKIEFGESPRSAIIRECEEECGLEIDNWTHTATLTGTNFKIQVFIAYADINLAQAKTEERLEIHPIDSVRTRTDKVKNLSALLQISLDRHSIQLPVILTE
jgi:8-oxo-dGTP diphosphatase